MRSESTSRERNISAVVPERAAKEVNLNGSKFMTTSTFTNHLVSLMLFVHLFTHLLAYPSVSLHPGNTLYKKLWGEWEGSCLW